MSMSSHSSGGRLATTNMTLLQQTIANTTKYLERTHEAYWAFGCVTFLLVLIMWAVWYTKLWRHKNDYWEGTAGPIVHDLYTPIRPKFSIKDLLHIRTKYIPLIKTATRKNRLNRLQKNNHRLLEGQPINEEDSSEEETVYR